MAGTVSDKLNGVIVSKEAIRQSIINKGVPVSENDTFASYASKINQISGGTTGVTPTPPTPPIEPKYYNVTYIDYDGTILLETAVTGGSVSPPTPPTHDYLIFNSWNGNSDNIHHDLTIGAMYDTVNDETYLWIKIITGLTTNTIPLRINKTNMSLMTVDWGDGVSGSTSGTVDYYYFSHTYEQEGQYLIRIVCNDNYAISNSIFDSGPNEILKRAYISKYINNIGTGSFEGCTKLESITLPTVLNQTGIISMFRDCYSLSSVLLPSGVTSLGGFCFYNCNSLSYIEIPSGVTSLGDSCFSGCYSLSSIEIPSGVTSIGNSCFSGCYSLSSIEIPSGVTSIGSSCFSSCNSLSYIEIPNSVTSIGNNAFQYCHSLTSIEIPSGVTSIGTSAFNGCRILLTIVINRQSPPVITNTNVFSPTYDFLIYVPDDAIETYKTTAYWSTYANRFRPISSL